ncbi:MAG TPA: hypothetical protein VN025_11890 [Candidatus Dormibacteraeota bacterium]|nr:hypothetical protein [Candidatus Dormibacteraeota bacterium]
MKASTTRSPKQSGIALLTTVLLLLLMSSMLVGFIVLVNSSQKLNGANNDYGRAFYGAEAGMEKMTADLGNLFDTNYSPSGTQVQAIATTPPSISGINYLRGDGSSGYSITYPGFPGNPTASNATIKSGPYQGMTALATPYTLLVNARTADGAEVKLQRTTQTVGIPMFQFGIFSDADLSFFPGPVFSFGGRTHTNGNLFLASGNSLTMSDRVTAVKNVIRTNLSNGFPTTTGSYNGSVNITTSPGTSSYRPLAYTEGSLVGTIGSGANPVWNSVSLGSTNYAGNLRSGSTGATPLNLGIVILGNGTTQPVDLIRRPVAGESAGITNLRYFAQASFKVLLSDNSNDIMNLPCIDGSVQPFDLSKIAAPIANWPATGPANALYTAMNTHNAAGLNTPPVPLAASGAVQGRTAYTINDHNGYWVENPTAGTANPFTGVGNFSANSGFPLIRGFLKIEVQTAYGSPCGTWKDVTVEVLAYGYAGRNINTYGGLNGPVNDAYPASTTATSQVNPGFSSTGQNPPLLALPTAQIGAATCQDVHPNAIIRLERVRDNPSNWASTNACGVANNATPASQVYPTNPTDYWPNALFDTREGTLRDVNPTGSLAGATSGATTYNAVNYSTMVSPGGVMNYVEIDMKNLTKYLAGTLAGSGHQSYDSNTAPNDYTVYVSDRRGNYTPSAMTAAWPPNSPSNTETGEYGFQDIVNPASTPGCLNGTLDTGEDIDGLGTAPYTYGQDPTHTMAAGGSGSTINPTTLGNGQYGTVTQASLYGASAIFAFGQYSTCSAPSANAIWPMAYVVHANEARQNPNFFFRRAVKLVNGSDLSALGTCPGAVACGISVAAENPVYIQGDFNCPGSCTGNVFNDPHVAASVLGDAVTLLSNNWNDVNSFSTTFNMGNRNAVTTYYRTAIMGGKNISFTQPSGYTVSQDFGTDGGVHNFLRYIENWGGQTLNYKGSIISMYYSRQANSIFKCCTTVYSPPTRGYNFDVEFLQPTLLPPRTPLFRDVNTTGFTQLLLPNQ